MQHEERIEQIAKATALVDSYDLNGLVAIEEQLQALSEQFTADCLDDLAHVGAKAIEVIGQIVMHETNDADASLDLIRETIAYLQKSLNAISDGRDVDSVRPPVFPDDEVHDFVPNSGGIDQDLLFEWLSSCADAIDDSEAAVLRLESDPDSEEIVAEVRRRVHTIKGECGVLSLDLAQSVCHEAESAIDAALDAGQPFPSDAVLAFLDWFKEYIGVLAEDSAGACPPHEALMARFSECSANLDRPCDKSEHATADNDEAPVAGSDNATARFTDDSPVTFPQDMGMDENLNDFLCEAREHLTHAEEALLTLEQSPEDEELIGTVFRAFHTIKGVAGFMNLHPIVRLAHVAETMLDQARSGSITLNAGYIDLTLHSCDMLTQLIGMLEGERPPTNGALDRLISQLEDASSGKLVQTRETGNDTQEHPLGEILIEMGIASRENVLHALEQQEAAGNGLRDLLAREGITDAKALGDALVKGEDFATKICGYLIELGLVTQESVDEAVAHQRESGKRLGEMLGLKVEQIVPAMKEQRRLRREDGEADAIADSNGATESGQPTPIERTKPTSSTAAQATPIASVPSTAMNSAKRTAAKTVKVNMARMDNLVNMVGELVIAQQMVVQDTCIQDLTEQRTQRNLIHVGKIIRDLQEVSKSLRMVAVKGVFQKMSRLVRDISAKSGKNIQFHIEGEDTELDRNVVDEIADPLVHMIRNSCDHGIETTEERAAAGKSAAGHVWLRAYHQGGSIVIEVEDDGRGLNREKILKKAFERGVIAADRDPADIPDTELFNLIFAAGFSTADTVTDISGRGVGMDVVRRNIEALRGKVEIESKAGKGSTFVMRLPLTMAIIDGMVVRVGVQRYVIPTLSIEQSFRPTADMLCTAGGGRAEMVTIRGAILPIYRLNRVFNLNEGFDDISDTLLIVLESNEGKCCLLVDEIIGQQQVVIKALGAGIGKLRGISGGAILGDGRVALILDIGGLVAEATAVAA